jgi:hypothetical protein
MESLGVIGNLAVASFFCAGSAIECPPHSAPSKHSMFIFHPYNHLWFLSFRLTIPQVVNLSKTSGNPLPAATLFPHRATMFARIAPLQIGITMVQFAAVKHLRNALDTVLVPSPVNLSLAYGAASVPLIAAKYNLIIAEVYRYNGRSPSVTAAVQKSLAAQAKEFWMMRIQPGLLWSFLRDSFSVG